MTSRALTVAVLGTGTIGAQVPATCCGQDWSASLESDRDQGRGVGRRRRAPCMHTGGAATGR